MKLLWSESIVGGWSWRIESIQGGQDRIHEIDVCLKSVAQAPSKYGSSDKKTISMVWYCKRMAMPSMSVEDFNFILVHVSNRQHDRVIW